MSRNFELLQRIGLEEEVKVPPSPVRPAMRSAMMPVPRGKGRTRTEEMTRAEIRRLVDRLFRATGKEPAPRVVMFCAVEPGEQSHWLCARAAEAIAVRGTGTVCVVDLNLEAPALHEEFEAENRRGISEALTESGPLREFCVSLNGGSLWLAPAGRAGAHGISAAEGGRLWQRLAEARAEFDFVLLDAPAVGMSADAEAYGRLADGTVLVVTAESSRRQTVRRAKETLEAAQVKLLGAVLDQRTFPIPERIYRRL